MDAKEKKQEESKDIIAKRRERVAVRQGYISLLVRVIVIAAAAYVFFNYVFLITQNSGLGMFPALKDGDLTVVFRLQQSYSGDDVVSYLVDGERHFGRIVASEGDVVTLDDTGTLIVNGTVRSGEILYPTYAKDGIEYPYRVPEGCIFVLGDYRTQTEDSRDFGPISMDNVEGKVITILRRRGI